MRNRPIIFLVTTGVIFLVLFLFAVLNLVVPQANKPINCGCEDTFSHVINFSNFYWDKHHSFGQNTNSAVAILASQGYVYKFTTNNSNSVDQVSVLVGPSLQKTYWEVLAVKGVGGYCFEVLLIKIKTANGPWNQQLPGTYYGYYKPDKASSCKARASVPQSYQANKMPAG